MNERRKWRGTRYVYDAVTTNKIAQERPISAEDKNCQQMALTSRFGSAFPLNSNFEIFQWIKLFLKNSKRKWNANECNQQSSFLLLSRKKDIFRLSTAFLLARSTTFTSNQSKKETNSKCFLLLSRRFDVTGEHGAAHLSVYLFSPFPSGKYF